MSLAEECGGMPTGIPGCSWMSEANLARFAARVRAEEQTAAARDVLAERQRQISAEGWTPEHDDKHGCGELADAAACYALNVGVPMGNLRPMYWPWHRDWWKPSTPRRNLLKAGALAEEVERLRDLLRQAADCIKAAVRIEQTAFDEPPAPVSEWDYNADQLACAIDAALDARADVEGGDRG